MTKWYDLTPYEKLERAEKGESGKWVKDYDMHPLMNVAYRPCRTIDGKVCSHAIVSRYPRNLIEEWFFPDQGT